MISPDLAEAIAAAAVGVALLWLVLQPLGAPVAPDPLAMALPDPEETAQGQALLALKEIEFDHATGKLSDEDFAQLQQRYQAAAIATLEPVPASDPVEAMVAARIAATERATKGGTAVCPAHGPVADPMAKFCPECGKGLRSASGACASCGTEVPAGGKFCPGCGMEVSPES